jgi:putative toxin-antitoxin system antitoxin component (TIGR02293 family)
MRYDIAAVASVLGGMQVLGQEVRSIGDLTLRIEHGLPKASLQSVAASIYPERARQRALIHSIVPEATYKRRRDRLTTAESEKTERLARIAALAQQVWGRDEDARAFLVSPHALLGDRSPVAAAATDLGARQVETLLATIEYGLPV